MQKEKNSSHTVRLKPLTYLALGDSYTIGEGVDKKDSYPNQLVAELQKHHLNFSPPTVIAQTGWSTGELKEGIAHAGLDGKTFDIVTLLIGVNNQYRGLSVNGYQHEFTDLVEQAILFAGGNPGRVVVLSIPDWGVTPFAHGGPYLLEKITREIDRFNQIGQEISKHHQVYYLDITEEYRKRGGLPENLVEDQLHPSGNIYSGWTKGLVKLMVTGMDMGFSSIPNQDNKTHD